MWRGYHPNSLPTYFSDLPSCVRDEKLECPLGAKGGRGCRKLYHAIVRALIKTSTLLVLAIFPHENRVMRARILFDIPWECSPTSVNDGVKPTLPRSKHTRVWGT